MLFYSIIYISCGVFETEQNNCTTYFCPWMQNVTMRLIALTLEIDSDQTSMGLRPATSAEFLIGYFVKTRASRRNIWDASATQSAMKREWYVDITFIIVISLLITSLGHPMKSRQTMPWAMGSGPQAFFMDYPPRAITHHVGPVRMGGC
jgi:hypothetical protein